VILYVIFGVLANFIIGTKHRRLEILNAGWPFESHAEAGLIGAPGGAGGAGGRISGDE